VDYVWPRLGDTDRAISIPPPFLVTPVVQALADKPKLSGVPLKVIFERQR
jgi:hypothetical protein